MPRRQPWGTEQTIRQPSPTPQWRAHRLVTIDQSPNHDRLQQAARTAGLSDPMLPTEVLYRSELPLLCTGTAHYPSVQKIVTVYLAAAQDAG